MDIGIIMAITIAIFFVGVLVGAGINFDYNSFLNYKLRKTEIYLDHIRRLERETTKETDVQ